MNPETLVKKARETKRNTYSPYSDYAVGATLLTDDGSVYEGVNIENVTFDMCSHAERSALISAVSDGHREFNSMAISTEDENGEPPCGTCRQFLAEFCSDDFRIYSDNGVTGYDVYTLGQIFPNAFRPENID